MSYDSRAQPPGAAPPGTIGQAPGPAPPPQFTEKERVVIEKARYAATVSRRMGALFGAMGVFAYLQRRRPQTTLGARAVFTMAGAIFGGAAAGPLGLLYVRNDVASLDDKEHFNRAIVAAIEGKRKGRPPPLDRPLPMQGQQSSGGATPPAGNAPTSSRGTSQSKGSGSGWGDDGFDTSVLYDDNTAGSSARGAGPQSDVYSTASSDFDTTFDTSQPSSQQGQSSSRWAQLRGSGSAPSVSSPQPGSYSSLPDARDASFDPSPPPPQQPQQEHQQQQRTQEGQSSSRWAQVRGERSPTASSWERVRQQNAQQS